MIVPLTNIDDVLHARPPNHKKMGPDTRDRSHRVIRVIRVISPLWPPYGPPMNPL